MKINECAIDALILGLETVGEAIADFKFHYCGPYDKYDEELEELLHTAEGYTEDMKLIDILTEQDKQKLNEREMEYILWCQNGGAVQDDSPDNEIVTMQGNHEGFYALEVTPDFSTAKKSAVAETRYFYMAQQIAELNTMLAAIRDGNPYVVFENYYGDMSLNAYRSKHAARREAKRFGLPLYFLKLTQGGISVRLVEKYKDRTPYYWHTDCTYCYEDGNDIPETSGTDDDWPF